MGLSGTIGGFLHAIGLTAISSSSSSQRYRAWSCSYRVEAVAADRLVSSSAMNSSRSARVASSSSRPRGWRKAVNWRTPTW